ncbi:MAG: nucleotide exchange factor GrpE [Candidatus Diapherotrites archaeon]|uniref:Protein GrpE n=1 Tax=Candidatus Iainarchaeum sp. TaxID=3101447 RepID=A0A939C4Y5_9ARCH|nr:nucleotide exchange factor GrpE [Candidatus Diapherotrites archaeon]
MKREKPAKKESEHKQLLEMKETLQRVQAEFENYCKRTEKEKEQFKKQANSEIVKELLPLLDSMQAAEENLEKEEKCSKEGAAKGIELLKHQLLELLQKHGLQEIKCRGEKFDPMLHDAIAEGDEQGKEENTVLEEIQKGYMLNDKVLRHSKVKVNRKEAKNG